MNRERNYPGNEPVGTDAPSELARLRAFNRRRLIRRTALLGLVLLAGLAVENRRWVGLWCITRWHAAWSDAPTVDAAALFRLLETRDALLVDVRGPSEYAVSHLRGAELLPMDESTVHDWCVKTAGTRPIVLYCGTGARSGRKAEALRRLGLVAYSLEGGMLGQAHAGEPFYCENGMTWRIHAGDSGMEWLLPDGYRAVSGDSEP